MRRIVLLLIILGMISCKKENTASTIVNEKIKESKSKSEIAKIRDFPLKDLSKVEVLSYEDRMRWDDIKNRYTKDLVVNYKLNFDSTKVKERVELNSVLKNELLELLSQDSCKLENLPRDCYMPRHIILFRDHKNRIIGYKELCLSCKGFKESKNLENYNGFCFSQMEELFIKTGIKYLDEDYE